MYADAAIAPGEADAAEQDAEYSTQNVHEQGVDTESLEESTPFLVSFHVDDPDEQCKESRGQPASGEDEGGRPDFLVDRATVAQQEACKSKDGANQK